MALHEQSGDGTRLPLAAQAAALALLSVQIALGFAFIRSAAPTYDEAVHLASGYSYLATGRYRLNVMDHPPFAEMWAALPLLALRPQVFSSHPDWMQNRVYHYSDYFLNHNRISGERMLNIARSFAFLTWSSALAFALMHWSRRLGGTPAVLGSSLTYALCPALIVHCALVTTDGASTTLFFLVFCLLSSPAPSLGRWIGAGLCFGLALASKFNMILLIPLLAGMLFVDRILQQPRSVFPWAGIAAFSLCAFLALAMTYRFSHFPLYGKGLMATLLRLEEGRSSFLMGEHSTTGFWLYFPVALAVKMPLATLGLGLSATALWLTRFQDRALWRERLWVLLPMLVYFAAAMSSKVQIGFRHILPMLPFLILLSGCGTAWLWQKSRLGQGLVLGSGIWLMVSVGKVSPHLLAYFNEIVGPSQGYRVLVDSNLDWGQDLKTLARIIQDMGNPPIYLSYFGTADPSSYGLRYVPVAFNPQVTRSGDSLDPAATGRVLFAISATNLQCTYFADKTIFDWLKKREPLRIAGYSIFLYDLTRDREARLRLAELVAASHSASRAKTLLVQ